MKALATTIVLLLCSTAVTAQDAAAVPKEVSSNEASQVLAAPGPALRVGDVGLICGLEDVIGQPISPIRGERSECAIADPVRVVRVGGIKLSRPATMGCPTAIALRFWVETGLKPVLDRFGWTANRLEVSGGYVCKTINNAVGGDISEHARGRAIDISAIGLTNGHTITISDGWERRIEGQVLRRLHRAACGPFGTVLGPEADRYHQNHFHFDLKPRRRPYCR